MSAVSRPIAFVFPGQGSQRLGMLDVLPAVRGVERLLDAAEALSGLDLRKVAVSGTPDQLADTRAAQPLLYIADWAWGNALSDAGLAPAAVAGHSLGEFAALAFAGVFSVEAGLELVVERSRLMAQAAIGAPGGMLAVLGMGREDVADAVSGLSGVWLANDNGPGQVVLSGTHAGLETALKVLSELGARKLVPLAVAGAFHSPLMADAAESFGALLARTTFYDATLPVYQNSEPSAVTDAAVIRERLAVQMTSPVRWTDTMAALAADGVTTLIESGPGSVLAGLGRRMDGITALSAEATGIAGLLEEV